MKKISLILTIGLLTMLSIVTKAQDSIKILSNKNAELYIRLAQISLANKDYKTTILYADSALALDKSSTAYRLKGLGQFNLGQWKQTVVSMSLGLEKNATDFEMHYYRGLSNHLLDSLGKAKEISEDMGAAITIKSSDTMAYYYKGLADFELAFTYGFNKDEKLKSCIQSLDNFLKKTPNFTAQYIRGVANFYLAGSSEINTSETYYMETIKDMTICLKSQPKDENCLNYRALSRNLTKDYTGSAQDNLLLAKIQKEEDDNGKKPTKTKNLKIKFLGK